MELATKVFSLGRYKTPKYFEELTKGWLFLPQAQNDLLAGNITMENLFKKYEKDPNFSHIYNFKNEVSKCHRDLRITVRILILVQAELDRILEDGRVAAKKMGFVFPDQPTEEERLFGPRPYQNHLSYKSLPTFKLSSGAVSTLAMPAAVNLLNNCKNITKVKNKNIVHIFHLIF